MSRMIFIVIEMLFLGVHVQSLCTASWKNLTGMSRLFRSPAFGAIFPNEINSIKVSTSLVDSRVRIRLPIVHNSFQQRRGVDCPSDNLADRVAARLLGGLDRRTYQVQSGAIGHSRNIFEQRSSTRMFLPLFVRHYRQRAGPRVPMFKPFSHPILNGGRRLAAAASGKKDNLEILRLLCRLIAQIRV